MPLLNDISADYEGQVTFVAVAGRSSPGSSASYANAVLGEQMLWGYDDDLWGLYAVRGQPTTFLITADNKVYQGPLYRLGDESDIRAAIDELIALHQQA